MVRRLRFLGFSAICSASAFWETVRTAAGIVSLISDFCATQTVLPMLKMQQHRMTTASTLNVELTKDRSDPKEKPNVRHEGDALFGNPKEFWGKALFAQHRNCLVHEEPWWLITNSFRADRHQILRSWLELP